MRVAKVIIAVVVSVLATFAVSVGTASASGDGMPFNGKVTSEH
jgi:hypothetical protein